MKLVIHMGLHKTASTSFQNFLYLNRDNFLEAGVIYPKVEQDKSHFILPHKILKNDWVFVENLLQNILTDAQQKMAKTVLISSEDFEIFLLESFMAKKFEELAFELGYEEIDWVCVLRDQWEYFNSLYSQLSGDGACLNYSAAGHDIINFGHLSIGNGTERWRFAFDYDSFIDNFLDYIRGSFHVLSFTEFIDKDVVGKDFINSLINNEVSSELFWKVSLSSPGKTNIHFNKEAIEINYLANFLGIEMSADFYQQNKAIFGPLVDYRLSLINLAKQDLLNKFQQKYPEISNRLVY